MGYREFGTKKFGGVAAEVRAEDKTSVSVMKGRRSEDFRVLALLLGSCVIKEAAASEEQLKED
eukprot:5020138-Amphidinium_carterae.3